RQHSNNATLLTNKQRKAPAMFGNASLFKCYPGKPALFQWCLSLAPGEAEWRGDNRHCGGHRLMSSVLNHPSAEWFYAYFICISLNPVRLLSGNLPIHFNSTLIKKSGRAQPFQLGLIECLPICAARTRHTYSMCVCVCKLCGYLWL
uniref:Uncharacterized protein n=1 Tax=Oncorhynchus mykiss TaxID=8022 RepID=A0A8C7TRB3_ONCMY